jgi:tetratricopeptide (TPR) repeat protein
MTTSLRTLLFAVATWVLLSPAAVAQTGMIRGKVITSDDKPPANAVVLFERKDIRGNYKVKINKKGEYLHAGLPLGTYDMTLEVNGRVVDTLRGVRNKFGDETTIDFNLAELEARQQAQQQAAAAGQLTEEQTRGMSKEEKEALDKALKEREQAMKKNKELNESFNAAMAAMQARDYATAIPAFEQAATVDPNQHVIWIQLGEAYGNLGKTKAGEEKMQLLAKGADAYSKGLALKPDDPAYYNNYGLLLAEMGKVEEAEQAFGKAAELNPGQAGTYFFNLGAIYTNKGQSDAAGAAFKKATELDPNHANAFYQYGIYLTSKASLNDKGQMQPAEGTVEAFQKYLELAPNGPHAAEAQAMIQSFAGTVQTEYTREDKPAAKPKRR